MMKNYLLEVEHLAVEAAEDPTNTTNDAVDWAIASGFVKLTYNLQDDVQRIVDALPAILDAYAAATRPPWEETVLPAAA